MCLELKCIHDYYISTVTNTSVFGNIKYIEI
jgi:hypothetical protein